MGRGRSVVRATTDGAQPPMRRCQGLLSGRLTSGAVRQYSQASGGLRRTLARHGVRAPARPARCGFTDEQGHGGCRRRAIDIRGGPSSITVFSIIGAGSARGHLNYVTIGKKATEARAREDEKEGRAGRGAERAREETGGGRVVIFVLDEIHSSEIRVRAS